MDDILLPDEDPLKETDNNVQENEALPNASTAESQNAPVGQKPEANLENDKLSQIAESPQVLNSPKQTVLGKLKAKQRLQAFLSPKTNAISPTKKKDADVLTKFNKKPKKVEKKISVIDEIELIKKEENDILHAIEAEMNERKRKSPTREEPRERRPRFKERNFRKRQSRSRSRTKSPEQRKRKLSSERYPKTWQEMRDRKLSLDDIKLIKNGVPFRPSKSCYDFRKQLLFNDPVEVNPLKVKVNAGPERSVPATQLRYTKQVPSISFSVTPVKYKPSFITHDEAIDFMPKQHRDVLKRLRDTSGSYVLTEPSKKLPRKWYPKITLPSISEECELLEPSLGLAILQNYSDEEEEGECEDTESTEQEKTLEESKINESQNSVDLNIEKSPKINKQISLEVEETVEEKPEEETEELHEEKSKKKKKKKKTTDEEEEVFKSKKDKKQKKQKEGKVKLKEEKEQKKKEEKDRKKEEKERKKEEKERKKEEKDRKKEEKERKKEEKVRKKAEEERKTAEDEKKKLEEEKKKAEEERNRAETERKKEEIDKEEKRKKDRDRKREDKSRYKEKTDEDSERLRKNKKDEKSRRTRSTSGEKYSTPKNKEKPRDEHESSDKKSEKKQRDSSTSRDRKDEKTKTPKRSKLATLDSYYDDFESLSTTEAITKPVPEAKTTDSVAKPSVDQKDSKKSRRESKSPHRDPNDGKLEGRKRDTEDRSLERKENGDDSKSKSARKEKTENLKTESRPPIKDDKTDKSTRDRKDKRRSKEATPNRRDKMRKRSVDHKRNQATKQECETPDTEEYHSHWESDTDMGNTQSYSPKPKLDTSWESDEELSRNSKKSRRHHEPELSPQYSFDRRSKKTSSVERSLEMPFNIKHVSRISDSRNIDGTLENSRMYSDDGWGDCSNYMNIGDLEAEKLRHEMEVLNHERKILEMEKRLVAEKLRNTEMGYVDFEENLLQDSSRYDYEEIKESKKSYKKSTDNYYKEKSYERTPKRPKHEPSTDRSHPEHTPPQDEEPKKAYDSNSRVRSEKTKRKRSRWEEDDVEQTVVKHKKLEREELEETEEKANSTCDDSNVTSNSIDKALLENEYEEFLKAVTTDIVVEKVKKEKSRRKKKLREKKRKLKGKKRRRYSTSSSSSSSSSSDSSSSDSSSSSSSSSTSTSESSRESRKKKKKKQKKKKTQKPIKLTKPIIENLSELEIGPCQTISIKQEKNVVDYDYELTVETVAPVPKIVPAPMSGALGLLPVKIEKDIDVDSTTSAVKSVPLIPTKFLTAVPLLNKEVMLQEVEVMSEEVVAEKPVEAVEQEVEMVNEEMVESGFSRVSEDEPMPEPTLGYPFSITLKQKPVIKETVGEPAGVFTDKLLQKSEHTTTTTREEKPNNEQTKPTPDKKDYIKQSPKHRSISPPQNKHQKDPLSSPIHRRPSPIRRRPSPRRRISPRSRELSPKSREHRQRRSVSPRHRRSTISPRNRKNLSPRSRRSISPRGRRNLSPRNRNLSPRNRNLSPRSRRSPSPRLNRGGLGFGQRRRSPSPRRKRSLSPHHGKRLRSNSPKRYNRSPSPRRLSKNYNRSYSRSPSMKREPIQVTLQRLASGGEDFSKSPSINSPVDGFKRSVADSTISDDQLLQQNADSVGESPTYAGSTFQRRIASSPMSPKRVPLDVRINQVLGIEKESPKPISTTYQNYSFDYSEQYSYGGAVQYPVDHSKGPPRGVSRSHVVQMGNVLEVVPTDNLNMSANVPKHIPSQKIVQVGNMLQIVPTPSPVAPPDVPLPVQPVAPPVMIPVVPISPARSMAAPLQSMENLIPPAMVQKPSPEDVMKLKMAERRAERQKRHEERELKRKEKEKRKKEREKKQQLKIKQKNENMIRALKIETEAMAFGENAEENEEGNEAVFWPGALGTLSSPILKPAGKGILMTRGFSKINLDEDGYSERKKRVKFADGIVPGEGTSPSGGEELSSPPPFQPTLPKEKRFKKIKKKKVKVPKKKKIKVKIIRKPSPTSPNDDDEDEDGLDSLPPPSPPPGSPPPHVYPARIKSHGINNVHPNYTGGVPFLPVAGSYQQPQQQQQQVQFRPTLPPLNMPPPPPHGPPHHGPPHHGPPPHGPPHHVPPPHGPPHHGPPPPHGPPHHGPPHIPPGPPHRPPHGAPPGRPF